MTPTNKFDIKLLIILIIVFIHHSCRHTYERSCETKIHEFIHDNSNVEPLKYLGLSIASRGVDKKGRRLTRITFSDEFKSRDDISNFHSDTYIESQANQKYLKYIKETQGYNNPNLEPRVSEIVDEFDTLKISEIHSQLHLGEFVEFIISPKCSVLYKKENAKLNKTYKELFKNANQIFDNWYIMSGTVGKEVLKEWPENFIVPEHLKTD